MIFLRQIYKILLTSLVAASTTWAPQDKCRQQGRMTQKILRGVKYPLLQQCHRLFIANPKKKLKVPHRWWPMQSFTHKMIKMKHSNKIKLTEQKKGKVQEISEAKIPLYRHFGRTSGQSELATWTAFD